MMIFMDLRCGGDLEDIYVEVKNRLSLIKPTKS